MIEEKVERDTLFAPNEARYKDVGDEIAKAFTAGTGITPETQTDAAAYRMESLDPTLNISTYGLDDYTIYNDLYRQPVKQTVRKYTVYYSHGKVGHSRFQPEIGIGSVNTPKSSQETVSMKFIVDTKQSSFAIQMAQTTVDTNKLLEISAINVVAKTVEWATFYGDADLTTQGKGNGYEFDGLAKLIDSKNVINAEGSRLTPSLLNKAAVAIGLGYGKATNAYMPIGVKADFINEFMGAQRILQPNPNTQSMQVGLDIDLFNSARGKIELEGSTIMDLDNILAEDEPIEQNAPLAPVVTLAEDKTSGTGNFLSKDVTDKDGNVLLTAQVGNALSYKVVAVGKSDSAPSDAAEITVSGATSAVTVTLTFSNQLQYAIPDYVAIYRQSSVPGDDRYFLIARVPSSELDVSTGTITFTDINAVIAGTADVFVGEVKPETVQLLEFAPLTKFPLATTTTASNFAVLWYGALQLTYPKRFVRIQNVLYNSQYGDLEF